MICPSHEATAPPPHILARVQKTDINGDSETESVPAEARIELENWLRSTDSNREPCG
jgi:hypothetical protein